MLQRYLHGIFILRFTRNVSCPKLWTKKQTNKTYQIDAILFGITISLCHSCVRSPQNYERKHLRWHQQNEKSGSVFVHVNTRIISPNDDRKLFNNSFLFAANVSTFREEKVTVSGDVLLSISLRSWRIVFLAIEFPTTVFQVQL